MTPMEDETFDPWDNHQFFNLEKTPNEEIPHFKSAFQKESEKNSSEKLKDSLDRLTANLDKKNIVTTTKNPKVVTMKERYEKAWEIVFKRLPEWRQKELTESKKDGTFGVKDWDTDFVRQVAALAESDDLLAA